MTGWITPQPAARDLKQQQQAEQTSEQRRRGDQQYREYGPPQHRPLRIAQPHCAAGKEGAEPARDFRSGEQRADRRADERDPVEVDDINRGLEAVCRVAHRNDGH